VGKKMRRIVECVPNFSEGRRSDVVAQIKAAISSAPGVKLLDAEMDADHNRSVLTFAGRPESVEEAAFRAIDLAAQLIDMDQHEGEHPRLGATDVVPFVPISGVTMQECVEMARRLGERVGSELQIPIYLYEKAATRPERVNLADVRRGEYEALKEEIGTRAERAPDFGPRQLGKAGATVIGAREPLIAYNVYLNTSDLKVAQAIARAVRHSTGGLRFVKALGLYIEQRGLVQVSMNLTDYRRTPVHRVVEMIRREAQRYGLNVVSCELVGLIPRQALVDAAEYYLQLEDFQEEMVLESHLEEPDATPELFLDAVAEGTPTPGGGSVAALAGALAAALTSMVCHLTLNKRPDEPASADIEWVLGHAQTLRGELSALVEQDSRAYEAVLEAYRKPQGSPQEKEERSTAVQNALEGAARVPLEVAEGAVKVQQLLSPLLEKGLGSAASDVGVAAYAAQAALKGASLNVRTNLRSLRDETLAQGLQEQLSSLEQRSGELMASLERELAARV
jgi:glutamate formiminotransferase/formiminotetrahydrofolate cyclodeaminase